MVRIRIGADEQVLTWEEWEERVRSGRVPPDALVAHDALTNGEFRPAKQLAAWRSLLDERDRQAEHAQTGVQAPILTALLIGVQVRIWWWQWLPEPRQFAGNWLPNFTPSVLENGESWRLLTMGFLHFDFLHIALNLMWLGYVGYHLERTIGRKNLLTLYLAAVLVGSTLSAAFTPWRPSVGASGGVFGLIAAAVVFGFFRSEFVSRAGQRVFGWALLPYMVLTFWSGLQSESTDNWAHFGGMMTGAVLGVLLDPEPLQRSLRWNLRVQLTALVMGTILLIIPVFWGPWLERLVSPEEAAWQSLRLENPDAPRPEEIPASALVWRVPAGWRRGMSATGAGGFLSPAGDRVFAVEATRGDKPTTAEAHTAEWLARIEVSFPEEKVTAGELEPTTIGGHPGVKRTVIIGDRRAEWQTAVRGMWHLDTVWEVSTDESGHLNPLRDRLYASIVWTDPPVWVEAERALALAPDSVKVRSRHAVAAAEIGEEKTASSEWKALLAEAPDNEEVWTGYLEFARAFPAEVPDLSKVWADALAAHPTPTVAIAVAMGLEAAGDPATAHGLLEVAWSKSPGDRQLKRARGSRGLPTALVDGVPWDDVFDRRTALPRPQGAVETRRNVVLSLDSAAQRQREFAAERDELVSLAVFAEPETAIDAMLRLKYVPFPTELLPARAGVIEDLRTLVAGQTVAWMPASLVDPLRVRLADPLWKPILAEGLAPQGGGP